MTLEISEDGEDFAVRRDRNGPLVIPRVDVSSAFALRLKAADGHRATYVAPLARNIRVSGRTSVLRFEF